ncbi:MAG TPA: cupin domain-containing protein [Anaerolineae bacterium]|nr:cupin domain-containing protein [Anaerolineae bacterium]
MMQFKIICWDRSTSPTLVELQEQLIKEGLFPYDWSNAPGDVYASHVHDYDKVIIVMQGSITWVLPETNQTFETHAGDRIDLPRGTWHAAEVGPQGVMCLEGHIV